MTPNESHRHSTRSRPEWLNDVNRVRQGNIALCANALRTLGVATITEIAHYTELSRPTVKERLLTLVELGLARPAGLSTSTHASSGRPANQFAFNASAAFVVGVELSRHQERILVSDLEGKIVRRYHTDFTDLRSGEERFSHLMATLGGVFDDMSESHNTCLGIGLALPGIISLQSGVKMSPLFPDHEGIDIAERFSEHFQVPVVVENDIKSAALAETTIGVSRGMRTAGFVYTWHEMAAALVINGRLHRGFRNAAGEINLMRSVAPTDDQPEEWNNPHIALATFDRAVEGDEGAKQVMEGFLDKLARQLTGYILALDPEMVVLGGGLALNRYVADNVRRKVQEELRLPMDFRIETTKLGVDGPALGVLHLAFTSAIAEIFGEKNAAVPVPSFGLNRDTHAGDDPER
ncbi:ROK family protein [Micrococcales bacterium 31B]|nr:ROK family protein [Micrococcales bacterium 31B]